MATTTVDNRSEVARQRMLNLESARYQDATQSTNAPQSSYRFRPLGTAKSTVARNSLRQKTEEDENTYERTGRNVARMYMRSQQLVNDRMKYAQQVRDEAIRKVKEKIAKKTAGIALKTARVAKLGWKLWRLAWILFWILLFIAIVAVFAMIIGAVFREMCTGGIQGAVRATASFFGNSGFDQMCRAMNL